MFVRHLTKRFESCLFLLLSLHIKEIKVDANVRVLATGGKRLESTCQTF